MAYKLIIVDDEKIIRDSLCNLVNWHDLGFNVSAVFEDGKEAIAFIGENQVDVVLTDIKMTFVSGLEIARYVHENKPHIKVAIISGHKDFEFARQSITYKVMHYLLKPTSLKTVTDLFLAIKDELDHEKKLKEQFEDAVPLLKEQLVTDIIMGALREPEQIKEKLVALGMDARLIHNPCCLIESKIIDYDSYLKKHWQYDKSGLNNAIRNYFCEDDEGVRFFPISNMQNASTFLAVQWDKMAEQFVDVLNEILARISQSAKVTLHMELTHILHPRFENLWNLCASHHKWDDPEAPPREERKGRSAALLNEKQKLLVSYINAGNYEAVASLVDTILEENSDLETTDLHTLLIDVFSTVSLRLRDLGINLEKITEGRFNYHALLKLERADQLNTWCKQVLHDIIQTLDGKRNASDSTIIRKAKEYIRDNVGRDITLEDVGEQVYISPIYLCKLFKKQTGENFTDYLNRVRMEKAIELLRDVRYKTYEVSHILGFKNTKYFSRLFRSHTGYTPSEYRHLCL